MSTPEEAMFDEALSAVRSGDRARARDLFTRLLKTRQDNPEYWIWMSAVVETNKERVFCLKEVLRIDPRNATALRGLAMAGAMPPDPDLALPARLQKRNWMSKVPLPGGMEMDAKPMPKTQFALMGGAVIVVLGLVAFAFFGMQTNMFRPRSVRPIINLPTNTAVLSVEATPTLEKAVAVGEGTLVPLSEMLKQTYTPTPLYVNTPHSISEAFRIGLRAYQRGEWEMAGSYFQQVIDIEPDAADTRYYLGETYRQREMLPAALKAYNEAIERNASFAPAYLGRARVLLAQNPEKYDAVIADLEAAIARDPKLGEAYLILGEVQVLAGEPEDALVTLDQAEQVLPDAPLVYLYRAQAYLAVNNSSMALENARKANQMDMTLLEAYRMIGQTLQAGGDLEGSLEPLNLYLRYNPKDAQAWAWLAKAELEMGDKKGALQSLNTSLGLNGRQAESLLLRANLLLEDGEAEDALDDFEAVMRMESESFEASLGAAKALMGLNYPGDAYQQIEESKVMAVTEKEKAEWLFWRAQSLDALGEAQIALRDYQSLVALPKGTVEEAWIKKANQRIEALAVKSPTPKPKTATPTPTRTHTRQPTQTATPTSTRQPTATRTRTPRP